MQLLVSVRSAAEVGPALWGGADIIDAKEPSNGSLGPVSTAVVTRIMRTVPPSVPLSIALGDFRSRTEVAHAVAALPSRIPGAPCYVKLGFAGISSSRQVGSLLDEGRKAAGRHHNSFEVVAVAYADADLTGSIDPQQLCRLAVETGLSAVLVDTGIKSSGNLFTLMSLGLLARLVAEVKQGGLLAALAGSLEVQHLKSVASAGPDIVGVRRAACVGGREGTISPARVRQLRRALGHPFGLSSDQPTSSQRAWRNARRPRDSLPGQKS